MLNIIQTLWKGPTHTNDGKTLGNCLHGITAENERLASKPHPVIQEIFVEETERYNTVLSSTTTSNKNITHLLQSSGRSEGKVHFRHGLNIRDYDEYDYTKKEIFVTREDFEDIIIEKNNNYVLNKKLNKHEITRKLKKILKLRCPTLPSSFISNLARNQTP
eukprot:171661_1